MPPRVKYHVRSKFLYFEIKVIGSPRLYQYGKNHEDDVKSEPPFFGKRPAKDFGVTLLVLHHHVISVLCLLRSLFKFQKKNCGGEKNTMYHLERPLVRKLPNKGFTKNLKQSNIGYYFFLFFQCLCCFAMMSQVWSCAAAWTQVKSRFCTKGTRTLATHAIFCWMPLKERPQRNIDLHLQSWHKCFAG